jgi:hypothetical protein
MVKKTVLKNKNKSLRQLNPEKQKKHLMLSFNKKLTRNIIYKNA